MLTRVLIATTLMALAAGSAATWPSVLAQEDPAFYVNTTIDIPYESSHCLPRQICPFRSALETAQAFGAGVRICFGDDCPPYALPLSEEDPGYDPATGRWTVTFDESFQPIVIDGIDMDVDLTTNIEGYSGPQDNVLVLVNPNTYNHMFMIEGTGLKLAGFEIRGTFEDSALVLRRGASDNRIGPGLALADFPQGNGIRLLDAGTTRNKIVGIWCGITIDDNGDPVAAGLREDCVHIARGANGNTIGGPEPEDRNVLSASELGFGVALHDPATRDNVIQGNYIGTDPTGTSAMGNESGVAIFNEATGTQILGNVISGNRNHGLFLHNASTEFGRSTTLIEDNVIGANASGDGPVSNGGFGISVQGLSKLTMVRHNQIQYNGTGGIVICGDNARDNTVTENSITDNNGLAIQVCEGSNEGVRPPVLTDCSSAWVEGTACPGCRVEVFSDPANEAAVFEGAVTVGADGYFEFRKPSGFTYDNVTATTTEDKDTSGLSNVCVLGGYPTLTPTPKPGDTPVPTSTPRLDPKKWIYLPSLSKLAEL